MTSPMATSPTSVQALQTRSPAAKRRSQTSVRASRGAFRRSSTKAKCPRSACTMLESASASSISNWNSCGSVAPSHRAEAHFLEPLDGIYAQLPVVFALQGGVADPLENGAVFLRQGFVLGTEEGGGVRLGHVKPPSNWGKVAMGEPATGISR